MFKSILVTISAFVFVTVGASAQIKQSKQPEHEDKFRQLEESWPTPNDQRIASGKPGPGYWQQQADYKIKVELNDDNQSITGSEMITYKNNSPHTLDYIWVRLDQNRFAKHSDDHLTQPTNSTERMSFSALRHEKYRQEFDGGFKIAAVTDEGGDPLPYSIVRTMMRIDLPEALRPGGSYTFGIDWSYNIIESKKIPIKRSGWDHFEKDGNKIITWGSGTRAWRAIQMPKLGITVPSMASANSKPSLAIMTLRSPCRMTILWRQPASFKTRVMC